jgi:hypothetical protein
MEKKIVKSENIAFKCREIPLTRKELKNLFNYHIPCLCCGMEMLHPDIYTELLKNEKLGDSVIEVVEILQPFENIMHPVERQVFNMFKSLANKYPNKNLQELLLLKKDVHELALVKIQSSIFNKISFYRRILPKKTARALRKLILKTNDIIFDPEPHKPFSRRIFIHKLKNICKNINNQKIREEIVTIARRLPRSSDEVCAFVVKNARKSSKIIALNLVHPSVGTFEHLQPKCLNGENNSLNFALECTYCNNSRHHYPISVQIEENPFMPDNAQIQIDKLISLCKKDLCKREYIENLKNALHCHSDGIIDVDIKRL